MSKKGMQFGPYEVIEKIGQGGMGVVYRAREARLQRDVALKILPERLASNPSFIKRFLREAQAAAQIEHPNIVGVHGVGEEKGTYWIAMQLVSGKPLSKLIEGGPMPWEKVLDIARQAAQALDYAHKRGVIHRDIKPDNLMVDDTGLVKVMDFGLAKAQSFDAKITESGVYVGTPEYSSPEQCESQEVDGRSDLYSLGVVLYEALSGQVPHSAETPFSLFKKIVDEPPKPLREINPEVPPSVAAVVEKLMQKDREKRYQSASELLADLDRARGTPKTDVSDRPATEVITRQAGVRRKISVLYPAIGLAAAGALALVLVLALAPWGKPGPSPSPSPAPGPAQPAPSPQPEPGAAKPAAEKPVVALVVDFKNIRNAEDLAWMRVGVPDMLITDLAQLAWLKVYSRDRVQSEMEKLGLKTGEEPGAGAKLARALSADILLKGTFVGVGQEVEIGIQVLSYPSGEVILSERALGTLDGLLGNIDELTRRIRHNLSLRYRPEQKTQDMVEALAALKDQLLEVSAGRGDLEAGKLVLAQERADDFDELLHLLQNRLQSGVVGAPAAAKPAGEPAGSPSAERAAGVPEAGREGRAGGEGSGAAPGSPAEDGGDRRRGEAMERTRKSEPESKGFAKSREKKEDASADGPAPSPAPAPKPSGEPAEPPDAGGGAAPSPRPDGGPAEGWAAKDKKAQKDAVEGGEEAEGAESGAKDDEAPGGVLRDGLKKVEKKNLAPWVEDPKDPMTLAMVLFYRAKDLREKSGGDPAALGAAVKLLREALRLQPTLKPAKAELDVLRGVIQDLAKKE